jgi:sporulation protein YlmC with PRC-barrel domain
MKAAAKKISSIAQLIPDERNANRGSKRGAGVIEKSLRDYGAGRSILIDKNGVIIAGNKTTENAGAAGIKKLRVIQTDGTEIIAVQRVDLDLKKDASAKALAIADNRSAELNLSWDPEVLAELGKEIDLTPFFSTKELGKEIGNWNAADGETALNHGYGVMIENISEDQQLKLLERLSAEGLTCRALTF